MRKLWLGSLIGLVGCAQVLGDGYSFDETGGQAGSAQGVGGASAGKAGNGGAAGTSAGSSGTSAGAAGKAGNAGSGVAGAAGKAGTAGTGGTAAGAGGAAAGAGGTSAAGKAGAGGTSAGTAGAAGKAAGAGGAPAGAGGAAAGAGGVGVKCGDGLRQGAEQCDGADLAGGTCTSVTGKLSTGTLSCTAQCTLDTSKCEYCGDNEIANGEECEGTDFNGKTCGSVVGTGSTGSLSCKDCKIDSGACSPPPGCGDGKRDAGEECDGGDFGTDSCGSLIPGATGTLTCKPNCTRDTSTCAYCGNGKVDGTESCDKTDFGGADCASVTGKPASGNLLCDGSCNISTDACKFCGNGKVESGEECDQSAFGGATCSSFTSKPASGNLLCDSSCSISAANCQYCGNGAIDGSEACDGSDLGSHSCASDKGPLWSGTVTCGPSCGVDTSACTCATMCGSACVDLQKDASNCGSCGRVCNFGTCGGGTCQPVLATGLSGLSTVTGLAATPSGLYAAGGGSTSVPVRVLPLDLSAAGLADGSVPITANGSGAARLLADSNARYAWNLNHFGATTGVKYATNDAPKTAALAGDKVLWASGSADHKVRASPKDMSTPVDIATYLAGYPGIAADSSYLYYTASGPALAKYPLSAGIGSTLFSGEKATWMALTGSTLVWSTDTGATSTITVGQTDGTGKTQVRTTTKVVTSLAIDADGVYWTQDDLVGFVKLDGTGYRAVATGTIGAAVATSSIGIYYIKSGAAYGVSK